MKMLGGDAAPAPGSDPDEPFIQSDEPIVSERDGVLSSRLLVIKVTNPEQRD